jgi:F0F1-type ATP synthase assembly protein I
VLITDPERRRARARRVLLVLVPAYVVIGAGVGYLIDGWLAALATGLLIGVSAGLGGWLVIRRERSAGETGPD